MELRALFVLVFLGTAQSGFSAESHQIIYSSANPDFYALNRSGNNRTVVMSTITAEQIDARSVKLSWVTYNEANNSSFSVEHSQNGIDWKQIGELYSKGNGENSYLYVHALVPSGDNYYRVVYVDPAGTSSCSKISYAKITSPVDLGVIPALCESNVTVPCPPEKIKEVRFNGITGRKLDIAFSVEHSGSVTAHIQELPEGIYFLQCGEVIYRFIKVQ